MNLDELRLEILINTASDEVGLWEIWQAVGRLRPGTAEQQKAEALDALTNLLDSGYIKAGEFGPPGWTWWDKRTGEIIIDIDRKWTILGHDPDLGDVAWFTSTPAGDAIVQGRPALRFSIEDLHQDIPKIKNRLERLLDIVGEFQIFVGPRILYQESEFPFVEFASQLFRWLAKEAYEHRDFSYTSVESDEIALVWFRHQIDGWTIGSPHQAYEETTFFTSGEVYAATERFIRTLKARLRAELNISIDRDLRVAASQGGARVSRGGITGWLARLFSTGLRAAS
jgi:hypothetical protein